MNITADLQPVTVSNASLNIGEQGRLNVAQVKLQSTGSKRSILTLSGSSTGRGVLTTGQVSEGSGSGMVVFNGGVLRANKNQSNFLNSFEYGDVLLKEKGAFIDTQSYKVVISSPIAGLGTLTKQGTGTLILNGSNGWAANLPWSTAQLPNIVIQEGTLQLGDSGIITTGSIIDNGNFVINKSTNYVFWGNITGSGDFQTAGTGVVTFAKGNDYAGKTRISSGSTLMIATGGKLGRGKVINSGTLIFNSGDSESFSGRIAGSGIVKQEGSKALVLTGANSHTGGTIIRSGSLLVGSSSALGDGNVTLKGGTLALTGKQHVINIKEDLVWGTGQIQLKLALNSNSERVQINGGLKHSGTERMVFSLNSLDSTVRDFDLLLMTVADGFGALEAGDFDYHSTDSFFRGKFRIDGHQLWLEDNYDVVTPPSSGGGSSGGGVITIGGGLFGAGTSSSGTGAILNGGLTVGSMLETNSLTFVSAGSLSLRDARITTVPEPSTWVLCGLGLLVLVWKVNHRKAA